MSYGDVYVLAQRGITWSAALEALFLQAPADAAVAVHEVRIAQRASETSEQLEWVIARTATDNSAGGSAATPGPMNPGGVAAGGVYRHTITAGISALTTVLFPLAANGLHEWRWVPSMSQKPIILSPAGTTLRRLTVQSADAPTASLTINVYAMIEEIGG